MNLTTTSRSDHIRVTGHGLFSLAEATEHFLELEALIERRRRAGAPVRVIVDLRLSAPQSADTADYVSVRTKALYRAEDRVAIMVQSSILKLQLKRIHSTQNFGIFLSEPAASEFINRDGDAEAAA